VLFTLLAAAARGAGQPISTQFKGWRSRCRRTRRRLARRTRGGAGGVQAAFEKGAAVLKLGWRSPLAAEQITSAKIGGALERLPHSRRLPSRPAESVREAAGADGVFRMRKPS